MIAKESKEYELWKEVYILRSKYHGMKPNDDKSFQAMVKETSDLYEKYKNTDAHIPATWVCMAIREMFNEEVKQIHWDNGIEK